MKRGTLKRKKALGRGKKKANQRPKPVPRWKLEQLPRQLFREAARQQRKWRSPRCEVPRARGHAHHVLYEQHARDAGANPHDPRNAMLVCPCRHCHYGHHHRSEGCVIPASAIPPAAREFMVEVLGRAGAFAYVERYYG